MIGPSSTSHPTPSQPDRAKALKWHAIAKQKMDEHARTSTLAFTAKMNKGYKINWHHRVVAKAIDDFMERKITRLMIFLEPQCGKSELGSRHAPALQLGKDPDHQWIAAAYNQTFASDFNTDVQKIMDSEEYRQLFPESQIPPEGSSKKWKRNSKRFDIVGRRGRYIATGVGGSATGRTGNTLSIDDPVKNQDEANSAVYREKVWNWYKSVARTRLRRAKDGKPPGIIIMMTRWHHDDLAGRLLAEAKANPHLPQWTVVSLPAEREDDPPADQDDRSPYSKMDPRKVGDALWPENRSKEDLAEAKADAKTWNALFQQRPGSPEGNTFKREWMKKFYTRLPERFDKVIQSWDLTFDKTEKGSFVVGQVWGKVGPDKYLIHEYRERIGFTAQLDAVLTMSENYPAAGTKLVEKKANGAALINVLQTHITGVVPVEVHGDKENRAESVSPQFRSGNVYLPHPAIASWVNDYIEEMAEFPLGKYNDRVDATSQALSELEGRKIPTILPASITGPSKWVKR